MLTARDSVIAVLAAVATLVVAWLLDARPVFRTSPPPEATQTAAPLPPQKSAVFAWDTFKVNPQPYGSQRPIVRAPTATLDELEMHVTTLLPGQTSHEPHRHANEELVIIREGSLETFSNGTWTPVGPGSVIFNASNDLHGVRNVGQTPVTYHVVNWKSPK